MTETRKRSAKLNTKKPKESESTQATAEVAESKPKRKNKRISTKWSREEHEKNRAKLEREIIIEDLVELIDIQCTLQEVAGFFRVSQEVIIRRCQEYFGLTFGELKEQVLGDGAKGKVSLRRYQLAQAKSNPVMAIWLGKNWLGQTDKQKDEVEQDAQERANAIAGLLRAYQGIPFDLIELLRELDPKKLFEVKDELKMRFKNEV